MIVSFPALMSGIGWDVNWYQLFYVGLSFAVWLTLAAVGAAAVVAARIGWLVVFRRRDSIRAGFVQRAHSSLDITRGRA